MIHLSLIFWFLLLLPGLAAICRWDKERLETGLFGLLAPAMAASLGMLLPLVLLGFYLELPLAVLTLAVLALVTSSLVYLIKTKQWLQLKPLFLGTLGIECLLLSYNFFLGLRTGSTMGADAHLHLARIRLITEQGLLNTDPFVTGSHFFPIYHSNIYHALFASCSQVTGIDHLGVWHAALPFVGLLIFSASYFLAFQITRQRWVATVCGLFFLATQATVPFLTYPNKIAPFCFLALFLGFCIEAFGQEFKNRRTLIWILLTGCVLSNVHGLYGIFGLLITFPTFMGLALWQLRKHKAWQGLAALAVLVTCLLAAPLIAQFEQRQARAQTMPYKNARIAKGQDLEPGRGVKKSEPKPLNPRFIAVGDSWVIKDPLRGFGGRYGYRYLLLVIGIALGLRLRANRSAWLCAAYFLATAACVLYLPPLSTLIMKLLGSDWSLLRFETGSFNLLFPALFIGGLLSFERFRKPSLALRFAVVFAVLAFSLAYAPQRKPHDWQGYHRRALFDLKTNRAPLRRLRGKREFLALTLPKGETVLSSGITSMEAVAVYPCQILAPLRGSLAVPDLQFRRRCQRVLNNESYPWPKRQSLLKQFDLKYYLPDRGLASEWSEDHREWSRREVGEFGAWRLIKLKSE